MQELGRTDYSIYVQIEKAAERVPELEPETESDLD